MAELQQADSDIPPQGIHRLVKSFVFYTVFDFVEAREVLAMQLLSRYFYDEKIAHYSAKYQSERDQGFSRVKHIPVKHQTKNQQLYKWMHSPDAAVKITQKQGSNIPNLLGQVPLPKQTRPSLRKYPISAHQRAELERSNLPKPETEED